MPWAAVPRSAAVLLDGFNNSLTHDGLWRKCLPLQEMIAALLALLVLSTTIRPSGAQYGYKRVARICNDDSQCDTAVGEQCYWEYGGCSYGQCMCDPRTHTQAQGGLCKRAVVGGDACTFEDVCPSGMRCLGGECRCVSGVLTADRQYCLPATARILGQKCHPSYNECFHKAGGYVASDVGCVDSQCQCEDGYKTVGVSCLAWNIGERGCKVAFQCQSGAVCVDEECVCPTGYRATASNTKCTPTGALVNLPGGATCDEIKERRYCAFGLVCHQCSGQTQNTCVQYTLETTWPRRSNSATSSHSYSVSQPCLWITCFTSMLCGHHLKHGLRYIFARMLQGVS